MNTRPDQSTDALITAPDDHATNQRETKKVYHAPTLDRYGALKNVTLGGSPGIGDSSPPATFP